MKAEALMACEPPSGAFQVFPHKPVWRDDPSLLPAPISMKIMLPRTRDPPCGNEAKICYMATYCGWAHNYDNLTSAVEKVLKGKDRREQEASGSFTVTTISRLVSATRTAATRKGGVEGLVGFARRNYMVPIPRAESLEELNEEILLSCLKYGSHRIEGREER